MQKLYEGYLGYNPEVIRFNPWKCFTAYSPLPETVEVRKDLSPADKLLFAVLCRYSQAKYLDWPSTRELQGFLNLGSDRVRICKRSLERGACIEIFQGVRGCSYKIIAGGKYQSIIPDEIMFTDLSHGSKLLYGRMLRFAGKKERLWATISELSKAIGVSYKRASRFLRELETKGFIETVPSEGLRGPNTYYFLQHKSFRLTPDQQVKKEQLRQKLNEKYPLKLMKN